MSIVIDNISSAMNNFSGRPNILTQPEYAPSEIEHSSDRADRLSVSEAVKNINSALGTLKREERHLNVDEDLGRLVVKIINSDTKEIVRQIPTEETLDLSKRMQELVGLLFGK
jgi:flagellar protein FlaG